MIDGRMLTLRRTACASALAAKYLARSDASRLLMVGTGALAPHLVLAHAQVRPIKEVLIWGRNKAKAAAAGPQPQQPQAQGAGDGRSRSAVRGADVISCATLSKDPLVRGEWLRRASMSTWSAASRRRCARPTIPRSTARASSSTLIPGAQGGRRHRPADPQRPHRRAVDRRRPRRADPGARRRPPLPQPDHAVQVGRHGDRGSRRRHPRLRDDARRVCGAGSEHRRSAGMMPA